MSDEEVFKFLKSLPAILGIAGFFAYLWTGQTRIGGEILKAIIEKLRTNPNLDISKYGQLTPAKIERLIQTDEKIRTAVNTDDARLLGRLVILQYLMTSLVLVVCALLVATSIWLYVRQDALSLTVEAPQAVNSDAKGLLVDLDPMLVEWTCTGNREQILVYLENPDSHVRCAKKTVDSNVRSVTFAPSDVLTVATDRSFHGNNRVESVVEWPGGQSTSEAKDMRVGIEVELRFNGTLLAPDGTERLIHTLLATIDHSTENLPKDYEFKGEFVATTIHGPLMVLLSSTNSDGEVQVPQLHDMDWAKPAGFVYEGPDDPRIVRCSVSR